MIDFEISLKAPILEYSWVVQMTKKGMGAFAPAFICLTTWFLLWIMARLYHKHFS